MRARRTHVRYHPHPCLPPIRGGLGVWGFVLCVRILKKSEWYLIIVICFCKW